MSGKFTHSKGFSATENGLAVGAEGSETLVADKDGSIYQQGTKVTATAAQLNDTAEAATSGEALVGAMVGGTATAEHDTDTSGGKEVEALEANGSGDGNRNVMLIIKCTEALAGEDTLPVFEIGDGTSSDAFIKIGHGGDPATLAKNAIIVASGELVEERPVEITVTDATGTPGTDPAGAIEVFVIALPVESD